ncbi:MAG TPA: hypothetical protein VNO26_04705 [Candidatus Limnocylindria bacterium]|nr:hypothetical protein [Candidatus Limnocylindria bacterium]
MLIGLVLAVVAATPRDAGAAAVLLKRAGSNLMGAPGDVLMLPYTFPETFVHGFYMNKRYSTLEKVLLTPVWGAVYVPACGFVSVFMPAGRFVEGAAMVPVGVATAASDYDWAVFEPLPGKRNAVIQKKPLYTGTRWCEGFFQ